MWHTKTGRQVKKFLFEMIKASPLVWMLAYYV